MIVQLRHSEDGIDPHQRTWRAVDVDDILSESSESE